MRHTSEGDRWDNRERENQEIALLRHEVARLRRHVPACRRIPKLLVLDLNGLLVHRVFTGEGPRADAEGPLPTVTTTWRLRNFWVYKRPYVEDFLRFCLDNFFVGVWTTASAANATSLLEGLLSPENIDKLVFLWDGKKCSYNGEMDPIKSGKPMAFKELRRLWESREVAGLFGPNNTLLIDDSHYKASLNPPHTAIHPAAWDDPDAHADDDALGPNGSIRAYLEALTLAEGPIPEFVRTTPFETFIRVRDVAKGLEEVLPSATPRSTTTPEQDYHQQQHALQQHRYGSVNEEEDDYEEDEIVLAPAMAGLRMD
ncbi:haloacid dehalogenase-like hydrolase superfamily isoform 1 [Nannochloropsis oceanica]